MDSDIPNIQGLGKGAKMTNLYFCPKTEKIFSCTYYIGKACIKRYTSEAEARKIHGFFSKHPFRVYLQQWHKARPIQR